MKNHKGFTLLEVLVTMTILSFGILGVISMQFAAMRSNSFSGNLSEATTYASDQIEKLTQLDYDHANLASGNHSGTTQGIYTISWDVTPNAEAQNTKTVDVTVTWAEKGSGRNLSMQSLIADV